MTSLSFIPFPNISTNRLNMRQLSVSDENEVFELRSDKRAMEFLGRPLTFSIEDAKQFIKKINSGISEEKWMYWGLSLKDNPKLIGTICIWNILSAENRAEIGYELHPDFQGNGLIQEAIEKAIQYGFETMELSEIDACLNFKNIKSLKILEKHHFKYLSRLDENEKQTSEADLDMVIYSLLNPKYNTVDIGLSAN
jgi:[ribosomal protein S5]-alanine N-acetyltransferase